MVLLAGSSGAFCRTVQGLVAIPSVEEHVIIGAFCDGASALAELGFVKASRSALAKVL
jgi:hypothetical protein